MWPRQTCTCGSATTAFALAAASASASAHSACACARVRARACVRVCALRVLSLRGARYAPSTARSKHRRCRYELGRARSCCAKKRHASIVDGDCTTKLARLLAHHASRSARRGACHPAQRRGWIWTRSGICVMQARMRCLCNQLRTARRLHPRIARLHARVHAAPACLK